MTSAKRCARAAARRKESDRRAPCREPARRAPPSGSEPLVRLHQPGAHPARRPQEDGRPRRPRGRDHQPGDLREVHRRRQGVRRGDPHARQAGAGRGGDPRPARDRRRARRLRRARARLSGDRRRGRLRQHRGLAAPRPRHAGVRGGGAPPVHRRRPAERVREDPGHPGGGPGHPAVPQGRPQHQHHAAVLADPVRGRRRRVPRGARVPAAEGPDDPRDLVGRQLLRLARRHAGRRAAGREGRGRRRRRRSGGASTPSRAGPAWPTPRSPTSASAAT